MKYLATLVVIGVASGALSNRDARAVLPFSKDLKTLLVDVIEWFGELGFFCGRLLRALVTRGYEFAELIRQCDEIGSKSLPLVALAGAATGVVVSLQTHASLVRFGAKSFLPAVIVFS